MENTTTAIKDNSENLAAKVFEAELLKKRMAEEDMQAALGANSLDVMPKGRELERDDFIMPLRISKSYDELSGKFYAKDSNRLMFADKGEKLVTSTTDKKAIADMVEYAKAKQWGSLKLSGSQEFRREAWLQAESQGIKTQGYTPKDADLAALKTLTNERGTNLITPLQERNKAQEKVNFEQEKQAPRTNVNRNQASMHDEATKNITTNIQALQKNPSFADKSIEELTKVAYWRGIVMEETKNESIPEREETLAKFDKKAADPEFVKKIDEETNATIDDKTVDQVVEKRDIDELSL